MTCEIYSHLGKVFFDISRRHCGIVLKKISLPAEIFVRLQDLLHPSHTSCFSSDVPDSNAIHLNLQCGGCIFHFGISQSVAR